MFSLVAVVGAMGLLFQKLAAVKQREYDVNVQPRLAPLQQRATEFRQAFDELQGTQQELNQLTAWMEGRYYWSEVLVELRRVLIRTEQVTQQKLRTETGIWVETFLTVTPRSAPAGPAPPTGPEPVPGPVPMGRPGDAEVDNFGRPPAPPPVEQPAAAPPTEAAPAPAGAEAEIHYITLVCRAVNLQNVQPDANTTIIYTLENELKASPMFDPKGTQLTGSVVADEATFTFPIAVQLKQPLKL